MLYSEKSWMRISHLLRSEKKWKAGGKKRSLVLKNDFNECVTHLKERAWCFFLISCDEHHKTVCERIKSHCYRLDFLPFWSVAGASNLWQTSHRAINIQKLRHTWEKEIKKFVLPQGPLCKNHLSWKIAILILQVFCFWKEKENIESSYRCEVQTNSSFFQF